MANGNGNGIYESIDAAKSSRFYKPQPEEEDTGGDAYTRARQYQGEAPPLGKPQDRPARPTTLQKATQWARDKYTAAKPKAEKFFAERKQVVEENVYGKPPAQKAGKKRGPKRGRKSRTPKGYVPKRIPSRMRTQPYRRATGGVTRPFEEPVYAEELMNGAYGGPTEVGYAGDYAADDIIFMGEEHLGPMFGGGTGGFDEQLDLMYGMGSEFLGSPRKRSKSKRKK